MSGRTRPRGQQHVSRWAWRLAAPLALAAALVLAACGAPATTEDATPSTSPADPETVAPADSPTSRAPAPSRADELTGAPVPARVAASASFDADRVNAAGGTFPSLDRPAVVPAADATWMRDDDLVLGAVREGQARAYPIFVLTLHHVSNDTLAGAPYLVTF